MKPYQNLFSLASRLLIALLFLPSGLAKIFNFESTVSYIASKALPLPTVTAVIAIIIEIGFSSTFAVGFKTRTSAVILACFSFIAALCFHNFWALPADQVMLNQIMFSKNMAIIGGLLSVAAFGAGSFSLDNKFLK